MFSEFKKRNQSIKGNLIRSDMYNLLRENTLARYNKYNVTKVLEHSMELDANQTKSVLKAVDFYLENLIKNPQETKRNERIILEYVSKVRDIKQFRDSFKRRVGVYRNKVHKAHKLIQDHKEKFKSLTAANKKAEETEKAVNEFCDLVLEAVNHSCYYDRVRRNYKAISKRFDIDKLIQSRVTRIEKAIPCTNVICEFVETYNLTPMQKLQTAIETCLYGFSINGCPYDFRAVLHTIVSFFYFNENLTKEEVSRVLSRVGFAMESLNQINMDEIVNKSIPDTVKDTSYGVTPLEKYNIYYNSLAKQESYNPAVFKDFLNTVLKECNYSIFESMFPSIVNTVDFISSSDTSYTKKDYFETIKEFLLENIGSLPYATTTYCNRYLMEKNTLEGDTRDNFIKELDTVTDANNNWFSKQMALSEGSLMGKVDAVIDKFKSSLTALSDKEKMASATFDAAIESVKKAIMEVGEDEAREDVIADRYIPRASRVVKLTLAMGLGYMIAPTLSIIGLFFYIAKTLQHRRDERRKVLNELDVEIDMCKKYIKQAEEKDDFEKMKRYKLILKKLLDTREKVKFLMISKGENVYSADYKNDDE